MSEKNHIVVNKKRMQTSQQILHNFLEIIELYPQYSIANHLASIVRKKDPNGKELFFLDDEELLKKIEQHKEELSGEELMNITE